MTKQSGVTALKAALEKLNADVVHVGVFDYATMFRERRLRREDLLAIADTAVFANVLPKWDSAEEIKFPGPYGSETIALDVESIRPYPFEPSAAAIVADYTGPQAEIMPRQVLRRQVARAEAAGYAVEAAFEFEFIVLNETADTLRAKGFSNLTPFAPDNRCWSGQTAATFAPFVGDLEALLIKGGIDLYSLSVELGPGCFEATLRHKPAMRAADDAAFLRMFTKAFCRQRNLTASFMSLLGAGYPGLGGHVAVSLKDKKDRPQCVCRAQGRASSLGDRPILPRRRDRNRARRVSTRRPHRQRLPPAVSRKLGAKDHELGARQLRRGRAYRGRNRGDDAARIPPARGRLQHVSRARSDAGRGTRRDRAQSPPRRPSRSKPAAHRKFRPAFRAFPPISSKPRGASGPARQRSAFSAPVLSITSRPCARRKMRPCAGPLAPRK